jgi:CHAT domain
MEALLPGIYRAGWRRGITQVRHAAWSPDGCLAVAFRGGDLWLWHPGEAEPRISFAASWKTKRVIWAAGGGAVSTLDDQNLQTWDAATGRPLGTVKVPGYLVSAAWSSDDRRIETAVITGVDPEERFSLLSCDPETGCRETVHEEPVGLRGETGVSADGRLLALSRKANSLTASSLTVWDLASRRVVITIPGEDRGVTAVALAPDGDTLALAFGGEIELWNPRTLQRLPALGAGRAPVFSLTFSYGGKVLAGWSKDDRVRLWWSQNWLAAGEFEQTAAPGETEVAEIAFHPMQPRLVTFDQGNTLIQVWDLDFEQIAWRAKMSRKRILFLAADPRSTGMPRLQIDREARSIDEGLDRSRLWDWFQTRIVLAARTTDISRELLDFEPQIVHFAGHGDREGQVLIENRALGEHRLTTRAHRDLSIHSAGHGDSGGHLSGHRLTGRALRDLLALCRTRVECVVLNACSSQTAAEEVAEVVEQVVGMAGTIEDQAAIAFSFGFYQALGFGRTYAEAYEHGCAQIASDLPGRNAGTPVFITRS